MRVERLGRERLGLGRKPTSGASDSGLLPERLRLYSFIVCT